MITAMRQEEHAFQTQQVPDCSYYDECGGCNYQHINYSEELKFKENQLKAILSENLDLDSHVFEPIVASPKEYHYRHRMDLRLLKTKEKKIFVGLSPKERRFGVVDIDACSIAMKPVSDFIPELKKQAALKLPERYRLANLVVKTDENGSLHWGGIGKGSLEMKEENYFSVTVCGKKIFYALDTFFQANLSILPKLFEKIRSFSIFDTRPVFFDLYGGVGLFSIGLMDLCSKSYLIENGKTSVNLARFNKAYHEFDQWQLLEGTVEEHLPEILKKETQNTVGMIDPPRAGLTEQAAVDLSQAKGLDYFMYLSCNPQALARDLKYFVKEKWSIEKIIPFDFFPKTKHLETFVLMKAA